MLSVAALSATAIATAAASPSCVNMLQRAAIAAAIFSPSKHPFMKRVGDAPSLFSFDPYKTVRAQIAAQKPVSASTTFSTIKKDLPAISVAVSAAPVAASTEVPAAAEAPMTAVAGKILSYRVVTIAFKHCSAMFRAPFRLAEGDIVIVEGDRGEHIGTVKTIHPIAETEALSPEMKGKIIRRATSADLEAFTAKAEKETATLAEVSKIAKDVRLNAAIADVEYQFDNNKLTIFVERASGTTFVDFRKIQRTLFKMFHCRIWFIYMDEIAH